MCNPRRVEVTATAQIEEAWQHEIRRLARLSGTAVGEARVRETLDDGIGGPTLEALEQVLARTEGWQAVPGGYRHELDHGYVVYHTASRELEIVARLAAEVEVESEAAATVRGEVSGTVEAVGEGRYYDDEWGGITEADARRAAERDAQQNLDLARRRRVDEQIAAAEDERGEALAQTARARADAALSERMAQRGAELRAEATRQVTAAGIQGRNLVNHALAEAFRDAFLAYARANHADRISYTEQDGVLEIEFELQA